MGDWGLSAKLQQDAEEVYIMLAALDTSDSVLRRREFAKALSGRDIDHKELFAAMDPENTGMVMWGQWMQHISDAHNEREAECAGLGDRWSRSLLGKLRAGCLYIQATEECRQEEII